MEKEGKKGLKTEQKNGSTERENKRRKGKKGGKERKADRQAGRDFFCLEFRIHDNC